MEEDEIEREMNLIFGLNASEIFPANMDTGSGSPVESAGVGESIEAGDGANLDSSTLSRVRSRSMDSGGNSLNTSSSVKNDNNDTVTKKQRLSWDTDDPGKEVNSGGGIGNLDKSSTDQDEEENVEKDFAFDPGSKVSPFSSKQD